MAKREFHKGAHREREVKEFDEEVLQIDRVTRVVKGGRRMRFRVLVAIGDRKGRVAIGIGKASEVVNGIKKAVTQAKKNLFRVPITEGGSIPHQVHLKYKAAKVFIMPAGPGTGIIAGGSLRKILHLAGVKNVFGKRFGTNNRLVTAQASVLALQKLKPVRRSNKPAAVEGNAEQKADRPERGGKPHKAEIRNPRGSQTPVAKPSSAKASEASVPPATAEVSATLAPEAKVEEVKAEAPKTE